MWLKRRIDLDSSAPSNLINIHRQFSSVTPRFVPNKKAKTLRYSAYKVVYKPLERMFIFPVLPWRARITKTLFCEIYALNVTIFTDRINCRNSLTETIRYINKYPVIYCNKIMVHFLFVIECRSGEFLPNC